MSQFQKKTDVNHTMLPESLRIQVSPREPWVDVKENYDSAVVSTTPPPSSMDEFNPAVDQNSAVDAALTQLYLAEAGKSSASDRGKHKHYKLVKNFNVAGPVIPSASTAIPEPLFLPLYGANPDERFSQQVFVSRFTIRGKINVNKTSASPGTANDTRLDPVRIVFYIDKMPNLTSQWCADTSASVPSDLKNMMESGSIAAATVPIYNSIVPYCTNTHSTRYHILYDKVFHPLNYGCNDNQGKIQAQSIPFHFYHEFKRPLKVTFDDTASGVPSENDIRAFFIQDVSPSAANVQSGNIFYGVDVSFCDNPSYM